MVNDFTQSQAHGFFWDSQIRESVFNLEPCKNDTKKNDIDYFQNRFNSNENVSIKTSKTDGFGAGDILRFYDADFSKKNTIILIKYNQVGVYKKIKEILEIDYTKELRDYIFGTITKNELENYVNLIKSIPPGRCDSEIKKNYKSEKIRLQKDHNMIISINPKVDSKNQRRVQCSLTNLESILNDFPSALISKTENSIVRGVAITESIKSEKRKRNK
jgi:hypothetical protein